MHCVPSSLCKKLYWWIRKSALLLGQLGPEHCQLSYFVPSWVPSRGSGFTEACHWHQPPQQHFWQKSNLVSANSCNAPGLCRRWRPSGLLTVPAPLLRNTERSANSCNATNYRLSALSLCPASNLSPVTSMSTFSTDPTDFGVDPHCRAALFLFDTNTTKILINTWKWETFQGSSPLKIVLE